MGLNKFVHWLIQTDLIKVVQDGNRYTIFAPTDEAIDSLPGLEAIEKDPDQLRIILKYHIIPLYIQTGQIENEKRVKTLLEGKEIRFNIYQNGRVYTASGAPFAPSNNPGNVLIAVVDRVLFPPQGDTFTTLTKLPILGDLKKAVERVALDEDLRGEGPFTFFAPSDKAFENLSLEERQRLLNNPQSLISNYL
ncbi:transforming growth factor-beta-induced protein ig-h3-like [Centruroides sculpturatus]|uniref:transforming growth factor-beta-induced protein ig-h3-like n=1 Tax=Centruroides sculpturatus TaxID=218467 RepID=UPI000C6DE9A0|nr:transforming growth factor-beta-induced protein ig-h3-like [Centruroides sculpturatus]